VTVRNRRGGVPVTLGTQLVCQRVDLAQGVIALSLEEIENEIGTDLELVYLLAAGVVEVEIEFEGLEVGLAAGTEVLEGPVKVTHTTALLGELLAEPVRTRLRELPLVKPTDLTRWSGGYPLTAAARHRRISNLDTGASYAAMPRT
jgi:hypothetical protein